MILGLVPARGGSKGVPEKNIRPVLGKPLIAYAIECGQECPSIDHVIVSTESPKIAKIAKQWGAEVPFLRPIGLAGDTTPMLPVMQHSIEEAEKTYRKRVEYLVLLDPTGPLRTVHDIEKGLTMIRVSGCDAVVSGNKAHRNPHFNMVILKDEFVQIASESENRIGSRQEAPLIYDLNTVVWIYTRKSLMEEKSRLPSRTKLYEIPLDRAIDLDTEFDFEILEFFISRKMKKQGKSDGDTTTVQRPHSP